MSFEFKSLICLITFDGTFVTFDLRTTFPILEIDLILTK